MVQHAEIFDVPGMLLVGSTGGNADRTEFACRVIETFRKTREIIAVRVTPLDRARGDHADSGRAHGVRSPLTGLCAIAKETDGRHAQDTSRFLAAGATRVLSLQVTEARVRERLKALLDSIRQDALWVCESSSIRCAVKPGVFLMVENGLSESHGQSAEAMRECVDCTVRSTPTTRSFDFDVSRLRIVDGGWALRENASAVILAGGGSRRMGTDKSLLPVGTRPMIGHIADQLRRHFDQVLVSAGRNGAYAFLKLPVVPDPQTGRGPLMGISAALAHSTRDLNFVTACDVPDIDMPLVRRMLREAAAGDYDAVVPRLRDGRIEPLHAVYRRRVSSAIEDILNSGERRVRALFGRCRVKYLDLPLGTAIGNLNTREEYGVYVRTAPN